MNKRIKNTRWLTSVALMAAIVILLANTPLGMIQLPIIKATTVHIPVILGAIILGPMAGAILGGVFGICSLISNTIAPTLLSFAFSPFMSMTGIPGALKAIWILPKPAMWPVCLHIARNSEKLIVKRWIFRMQMMPIRCLSWPDIRMDMDFV